MTRWMYPPEIERQRALIPFDPVVEGARRGLSRELALVIWQRAQADATDRGGLCDPGEAQRRFRELAARIAARGGRREPDVGRLTRVAIDAAGEPLTAWDALGLLPAVPGRDSLVAAEARRAVGQADREVVFDASRAETASLRAGDPVRTGEPGVPRRGEPIDREGESERFPLSEPAAPRLVTPRGHAAPPFTLACVDRATQVRVAARLHRSGELGAALGRGAAGLADAVAAALHDGAIPVPHPVDRWRTHARGLAADLTAVGVGAGRAAGSWFAATPAGQRAFALADALTDGAARAWSARARGWVGGAARRAMAYRDGEAAPRVEEALGRLSGSGGAPLSPELCARMEALFGHRFRHVRICCSTP